MGQTMQANHWLWMRLVNPGVVVVVVEAEVVLVVVVEVIVVEDALVGVVVGVVMTAVGHWNQFHPVF